HGEVQGTHLVVGGCLGPDHRPLGDRRELDLDGTVLLPGVALPGDLDIDPDDPMVVLLQPGELLLHMTTVTIRDLAVSSLDHNVHVDLRCSSLGSDRGMESARPTWSSTPQ